MFPVLQGNESLLQQAAQQTALLRHPGFHSTVPKE
jgi:hypothetical protein